MPQMEITSKSKKTFAAVVILSLFFLLLMWILLHNSNGFYLVAVVDLTALLSIFLWLMVHHAMTDFGHGSRNAACAKTTATASVFALIALVAIVAVRGLRIRRTFYLVAATDAAIILSLASWALCPPAIEVYRKRSRRRGAGGFDDQSEEVRLEYNLLRLMAGLPVEYRYDELVAATDNFQTVLGRGSSGAVYCGILDDGTAVAVKRIEGGDPRQRKREFMAEVAAIASIQHANLVRLLGYCLISITQRLLVYEFIPGGSLAKWIFSEEKAQKGEALAPAPVSKWLTWGQRYQVAVDVARALSYLHHDCRRRVLHLDIKPENILLDEGLRAYVADFGLSKLVGKDEGSSIYTTLRGTRGYFAPEWFMTERGVTEKSDVYSYGMVLLELVGGRRNVVVEEGEGEGRGWSYFPRVVSEKAREGKVMEVVDGRLEGVEEREVMVVVHVALWCIQERPEMRPSMARVVGMLEGDVVVERPPPTPMFMVRMLSADAESGSSCGSGGGGAATELVFGSSGSRPTPSGR